jgi:hypothetical protein
MSIEESTFWMVTQSNFSYSEIREMPIAVRLFHHNHLQDYIVEQNEKNK